ncbi:hypothetical protein HF283_09805 [Acidithiobacillus ferrooxidans]|uniref:hypothetical protein n=1 Tax=Acidithiobacillus ferridurans TaxID=1232575 RepID=UPI001C06B072|nr:hypothetical protein [Acidithiobacillus ferridurans]MBU2805396.1 hypothetical protein [Acidithiobacillus ferridurans]MBU2824399.1 hypothetical protein [Acidithiobacillus ferrooxidans]
MAKVNITDAARMAGKSRSYFYEKYINTGAISVETDREGRKVIDTAELVRVFGNIATDDTSDDEANNSAQQTDTEKDSKIAALQAQNDVLREYLHAQEKHLQEKEREVEWLREQVGKATALLTHQVNDKEPKRQKAWWWPW